MQSLHNAMIGIGYALIVLFFAISLFKTLPTSMNSNARRLLCITLFVLWQPNLGGYGMDIMLNIFPSATALFRYGCRYGRHLTGDGRTAR